MMHITDEFKTIINEKISADADMQELRLKIETEYSRGCFIVRAVLETQKNIPIVKTEWVKVRTGDTVTLEPLKDIATFSLTPANCTNN